MSSIALGAAFAAVQLVHQAHSKVKTSRARCARLVERCQFVVDRLERIAATRGGDAIIGERIRELERCAKRLFFFISRFACGRELTIGKCFFVFVFQGFRIYCADHSSCWPAGHHRVLVAIRVQRATHRIVQRSFDRADLSL